MSFQDLCPLQQAAQEAPSYAALISTKQTFSFTELDRQADLLSLQLHHLKVQAGDRIAVLHPNCPELIALFFAAWRIGASICPLNLRLPPQQITSYLERLSPKLFISSFPFNHEIIRPHSSPGLHRSLYLFTSGSTGLPKIAVLSLRSLITNAQFSVPLEPQDRWLLSLPLFHVGGIGILMRCILSKAAIVLEPTHPEITHLSYVPTQLYRSSPTYKNLKCLLLGGSPISSYDNRFPIYMTYGLTEMGSMVAAKKKPPQHGKHYYLGPPLPNREVHILQDGEICVRGETLFQGYWENGRMIDPLENGWFATGDIGCYDPLHGLAIIGRKDWQFISGGENIQPEEIEQLLLQIPDIIEAVVIPLADKEFGARPAACIHTTNQSLDLQKIQNLLSHFLPKYKIPTSLFYFDELPKKGLKIDRKKIYIEINKSLFIEA